MKREFIIQDLDRMEDALEIKGNRRILTHTEIADYMLSVIRQNVHLVAKVCPDEDCVKGKTHWKDGVCVFKDGKHIEHTCPTCKGFGVVEKGD